MIPEVNSNTPIRRYQAKGPARRVVRSTPESTAQPISPASPGIPEANKEMVKTQEKFWLTTPTGVKLDPESLHRFLNKRGFFTYQPKGERTSILVRAENKTLKSVSAKEVRKIAWDYIDSEFKFQNAEEQRQVKYDFQYSKSLFGLDNLDLLPLIKVNECRDTKETSYLFFTDCFLEIKANALEVKEYSTLEGFVFETDICKAYLKRSPQFNRICTESIQPEGEFYEFVQELCSDKNKTINQDHLESLITIIGYLVHRYKDPAKAKAIIFMDTYTDGNANGGTGKSLLTKGISHVRESAFQDGKFFTSSDKFAFSHVKYGTRILIIDDVPSNFSFEKIFPLVTEKAVIERKYENKFIIPFEESPKIVITTNYTVDGSGNSHKRRKVEFILSETFSIDFSPEDRFGHLLFIQWDENEWWKFYRFIIYCVQEFLKKGIVMPSFNTAERKLKMEATPKFIEYMERTADVYVKLNKKTVYDDFYSNYPGHHKIELTTFTRWLKYYADANDLNFIESHSGNENFFEFTIKE
jgi:hypothetical protein